VVALHRSTPSIQELHRQQKDQKLFSNILLRLVVEQDQVRAVVVLEV
jgi:hypothetical protein